MKKSKIFRTISLAYGSMSRPILLWSKSSIFVILAEISREEQFTNNEPYFPKYGGSLIEFVSDRIWAGGRDQHRHVLKMFGV